MKTADTRIIRAPTGTELSAKSWLTEAPLRMIMNNLDPQVAERPEDLVVYGGIGKAARNWECFDAICDALRALNENETLLIQSGKPVACDETALSRQMRENRDVSIRVEFPFGDCSARFWTSDLTQEYVRLNSEYTT